MCAELATDETTTDEIIARVEAGLIQFNQYYEKRYYAQKWEKLSACLPVFHQLLHVADGMRWIGPMHVYSQWTMERVCGMITRTAKSRVAANRNMELTLLLTEQKFSLSYVLDEEDWNGALEAAGQRETQRAHLWRRYQNANAGGDELESDDNSENGFDSLGLEKEMISFDLAAAFSNRVKTSRPPLKGDVKARAVLPGRSIVHSLLFCLKRLVCGPKPAKDHDLRRIRDFFTKLGNYHAPIHGSETIDDVCEYQWCCFYDLGGDKKAEFKVTSRIHRAANNTRNSSMIMWVEPGPQPVGNNGAGKEDRGDPEDAEGTINSPGIFCFGEVQYFFTAGFPDELMVPGVAAPRKSSHDSREAGSASGSGDDAGPDTKSQHILAMVQKFAVVRDGRVLKKVRGGKLVVVHAGWVRAKIGVMLMEEEEFIVKRNFTLL